MINLFITFISLVKFIFFTDLKLKNFVFFSENKNYSNVFYPIIMELLKKKIPIIYITSDRKDFFL